MTNDVASDYRTLVSRLRSVVHRAVPPGATVAVVSKGDQGLLDLKNRHAWHFPQRPDGVYAGHYPADSASAIAHLETVRARGARFLVFPATAFWWLDHYGGLREHLERHYRCVIRLEDTCFIYTLIARDGLSDRHDIDSLTDPLAADAGELAAPLATMIGLEDERLYEELRIVFDADFYASQLGRTFPSRDAAMNDYLESGVLEGHDPNALFDTAYYLEKHPEVAALGINPLAHFLRQGGQRGFDPSPYFDTAYYYAHDTALRANQINPLVHYITNSPTNSAYEPNPFFSAGYYLTAYPDVRFSGHAPLAHYLQFGCDEGRFASHVHQNMAYQLNRSGRSPLIRGNWKKGTILLFSRGTSEPEALLIARVAELMGDYHLESVLVFFERPSLVRGLPTTARRLVLDDYQSACDVLRPSASRLFTRGLSSLKPLFAFCSLPEVLETLERGGVPSYFLFSESDDVEPKHAAEIFEHARRAIFPSASRFEAITNKLTRLPTNVARRSLPAAEGAARRNGRRGAPPPQEPDASVATYTQSLLELAARDFDLDARVVSPSVDRRLTEPTRKILIPCADWGVSGVNASLEAVGQELVHLGWGVEILFTRDRKAVLESSGGESHLPQLRYRFLEHPHSGAEGMWEALIAEIENQAPCILLLAYDFLANSVAPALTEDVGVVTWLQADDGDYYEQAYRLGRYCNALVCVSQCIKDKITAHNPAIGERATVIHNASLWEREIVRRRRLPGRRLKIVYTGRLVQYQKRILDFVELAHALDRERVPYTISLIGDFATHDEARELFAKAAKAHLETGTIVLPGRLPRGRILQELSKNDFFVLLSDFEGLPLALVEAMARGCVPVVADADSGIPEVVTDGQNGLIVRGRDYDEWARVLVDLWRSRERFAELAVNARETVRARFTVEHVAQQFDELLHRVSQELAAGEYRRPPALHWGEGRSLTGDVLPPPFMYRPDAPAALR
jgi:glycosyltransferase involved in cell wall biosynthesis